MGGGGAPAAAGDASGDAGSPAGPPAPNAAACSSDDLILHAGGAKARVPAALARRLTPLQIEGLRWLFRVYHSDLRPTIRGGILSDGTGLGKTVQSSARGRTQGCVHLARGVPLCVTAAGLKFLFLILKPRKADTGRVMNRPARAPCYPKSARADILRRFENGIICGSGTRGTRLGAAAAAAGRGHGVRGPDLRLEHARARCHTATARARRDLGCVGLFGPGVTLQPPSGRRHAPAGVGFGRGRAWGRAE